MDRLRSLAFRAASPRSGAHSPRPGTASPRPGAHSPRPGTASPRSGAHSPRPGTASPIHFSEQFMSPERAQSQPSCNWIASVDIINAIVLELFKSKKQKLSGDFLQKIIANCTGAAVSCTVPVPVAGTVAKHITNAAIKRGRKATQRDDEVFDTERLYPEINALMEDLRKLKSIRPRASSFDGGEPSIPARQEQVAETNTFKLEEEARNLRGTHRACQSLEKSKMADTESEEDQTPYIDDVPTQRRIGNVMELLQVDLNQELEEVSSEEKRIINAKLECLSEAENIMPGVVGSRAFTPSRLDSGRVQEFGSPAIEGGGRESETRPRDSDPTPVAFASPIHHGELPGSTTPVRFGDGGADRKLLPIPTPILGTHRTTTF